MVLDDLRQIHKLDKQDMFGAAEHQLKQLQQSWQLTLPKTYKHVVLAGMGGSAVGGEIALVWPGVTVPFEIVRGYDLPASVGKDTLVILSSYSGSTEETLSCLKQAEAVSAGIAVIAAGGPLAERATTKGYPFAKLGGKTVRTGRVASLQGFAALLAILEAGELCNSTSELNKAVITTRTALKDWRPDNGTSQNLAKQIALEVMGRSIVIYAGPTLEPVAKRWKIAFNENAKNLAWTNALPELNHNEFTSWSGQPHEKPYATINLTSSFDNDRVKKRFEVTDQLLSGRRAHPFTIRAEGKTIVEQVLWTATLGDFVSLYLAMLNNVDPAGLPLVDKLKYRLA